MLRVSELKTVLNIEAELGIEATLMIKEYSNVVTLMRRLGPIETASLLEAFNVSRHRTYPDSSLASNIVFLLRRVPEDKLQGFMNAAVNDAFAFNPTPE